MSDLRLTTRRLRLRSWRDSDRSPFAAMNADPAVCEFLPGTLTREQSDALVDRFRALEAEHGFTGWAVEETATGTFVGYVGLVVPRFEPPFAHASEPCVEIGWRLARASWGQGYATEAARACLEHAFGPLALPEVVSFTVPANARSRAVMERIGMTHDAGSDFDHPALPAGDRLSHHVLYRAVPARPEIMPT